MTETPKQGEMDFGEWLATLIAHGMNNQEILTYLDPDTREEDLVALVRHLMEKKPDEREMQQDGGVQEELPG